MRRGARAIALGTVLAIACAGNQKGGESHFVCSSDSDCPPERPVCVTKTRECTVARGIDAGLGDAGRRDGTPSDAGLRSSHLACENRIPLWSADCAACVDGDSVVCGAMDNCDARCRAFTDCIDACGGLSEATSPTASVPNPDCLVGCRDRENDGTDNSFPDWVGSITVGGKNCAYGACAVGSRWNCVGTFRWSRPAKAEAQVSILSAGIQSFKYCDGTELGCPQGTNAADAGTPSLLVPTEMIGPFGALGTRSYFEFRWTGSVRPILFYPGHPILADERLSPLGLFDDATGEKFVRDAGAALDPSKAVVVVLPVADCTGGWAPGVHVMVDGQAGIYSSSMFLGAWGPSGRNVTAEGPAGVVFPNLRGGRVVVVEADYRGSPVASERVEVRDGATTMIQLFPSSAP